MSLDRLSWRQLARLASSTVLNNKRNKFQSAPFLCAQKSRLLGEKQPAAVVHSRPPRKNETAAVGCKRHSGEARLLRCECKRFGAVLALAAFVPGERSSAIPMPGTCQFCLPRSSRRGLYVCTSGRIPRVFFRMRSRTAQHLSLLAFPGSSSERLIPSTVVVKECLRIATEKTTVRN